VRVRWPIHVFAIDPVIGEQNVSDALARRRETQLALALAFTQGQLSAQNFSSYARRVDYELETIALNRTVVGFSHGADTFGWRFYPRVQTPPIDGNAKVFFRDLLHGPPSRDQDLRKRQLESGSRELLAIAIMPAFVPAARLDVRANWFDLCKPDRKRFSTEDSVRMGEMVQYIRQCKAQCLAEGGMSRPGDAVRLIQAVDQLEKRLPLQDTIVQIPHENSDGGFELFSEGTRNLGPELIGFYGEPGLDPAKGGSLFLVGRNFNVNVTQVQIGNQSVKPNLLSREVMQVSVNGPLTQLKITEHIRGVPTVSDVIEAQVATPYGVSSKLYIPVATKPAAQTSYSFDPTESNACLQSDGCVVSGVSLPVPIKIKNGAKGNQLQVKLTAILGDGSERQLKIGSGTTLKTELEFVLGDGVSVPQEELSKYFQGSEKLFVFERPIALKLTAKIKKAATDKDWVDVGNVGSVLLIRLGSCSQMNFISGSACSNCTQNLTVPPQPVPAPGPTFLEAPFGPLDETPPPPPPPEVMLFTPELSPPQSRQIRVLRPAWLPASE
jgi:hypothetical protein